MFDLNFCSKANKLKKKLPQSSFTATSSSNEVKNLSNTLNRKSKSFKASHDHKNANKSNRTQPYHLESFEHSNSNTKSSNSNTFTRVFSRLEPPISKNRSPSLSACSFSNLNSSDSSTSYCSMNQIDIKTKLRSSLSPSYLKKQNHVYHQHSSTIRENFFEPIVDNLLDDDESTLINVEKDSPNFLFRLSRQSMNRKSRVSPQPLAKLPVHDFGRTFSTDFNAKEKDVFRLKMIPLKRSLTLENSKKHHVYHQQHRQQQQEQYFQSAHAKRNPATIADQNLNDYFNSNMYNQSSSNKSKQNTFSNSGNRFNLNMASQIFRRMSTTTTTTSMPKTSTTSNLGYFNYNNSRKNMYKEYAAFCTCNSLAKKKVETNNFMNISDKRYMSHNTMSLNSSSRPSRKTSDAKKYDERFPLDFAKKKNFDNKKLEKSNDLNLNLNNILKNNPYQTNLNIESSDYEDEEEEEEEEEDDENKESYEDLSDVDENYLRRNEGQRGYSNSFHRPHSSIQFENQEIDEAADFFDNSINNPFMTTNHYTNVFKNRFNHFNLMNEVSGDYNLKNVSSQYFRRFPLNF
jgi:hypothetical protein